MANEIGLIETYKTGKNSKKSIDQVFKKRQLTANLGCSKGKFRKKTNSKDKNNYL